MSENPTDPPQPSAARIVNANEQQRQVIMRLAAALGHTLLVNWDTLPTGMTRGLKFAEMGAAALVRALAQLLAGASEQLPDGDAQLEEVQAVHVEMFRDAFSHARQELLEMQQRAVPTGEPVDAAAAQVKDANPPPVMVAAPKLLM